jgi:hypothetical protein
MNLTLTLDYTLSPGWLSPYVEGLRRGEAIAARCTACGRTSLPPQRACACGSTGSQFVRLSGEACVAARASGTDGDFALVRFDGADTLSVARLEGWGTGTRGCIRASPGERPALILAPKGDHAP